MKDKILNALKSKTFFALAINIVIMALIIVVTAFSYDSADDFYNSLYICQYHNYYNNDINYIFAIITGSLQYILLNFNCFVLFQIQFFLFQNQPLDQQQPHNVNKGFLILKQLKHKLPLKHLA